MRGNKKSEPLTPPRLHVAIPAMEEFEWLPRTLECLARQETTFQYEAYICVNQPETWWQSEEHLHVCHDNAQLLRWLNDYQKQAAYPIHIIDKSSQGKGWLGKQHGVGWARKTLFEHILGTADAHDLVVSMDADTEFSERYLASVADNMVAHPQWVALSVPYYHRLTGEVTADRAILRYEIYMRSYALNMLAINSPYAFTAIGSAIVVRAEALAKIGGITPMKSGEDFYLLQKLRKMGEVGTWNEECVHPAARFSDRVIFGTGPAMARGASGDWEGYPIYDWSSFAKIAETYHRINQLYTEDVDNDFIQFLKEQFKTDDLWGPLRANVTNVEQFRRRFHEKADGLRILQFLRQEHLRESTPHHIINVDNTDQTQIDSTKQLFKTEESGAFPACSAFALDNMSIEELKSWRDLLFRKEMEVRQQKMDSEL